MKTRSKSIAMAVAAAVMADCAPALAHDGDGLSGMFGSHWHAGDAWGFVALAVVVGLALALSRGGKP